MAVGTKGARQFQSLFDVIPFKATMNFASGADGVGENITAAVPGAALGDLVLVSLGVSQAGVLLQGYVSATDVVTVRVQNESGGVIDLASTTVTGIVLKPKGVFNSL